MRPPSPAPDDLPPAIPPGVALAHGCCGAGMKLAVPGPASWRARRAEPEKAAPDTHGTPEERP